jgi:hypothetical protein
VALSQRLLRDSDTVEPYLLPDETRTRNECIYCGLRVINQKLVPRPFCNPPWARTLVASGCTEQERQVSDGENHV